jgi:hypothetical protein
LIPERAYLVDGFGYGHGVQPLNTDEVFNEVGIISVLLVVLGRLQNIKHGTLTSGRRNLEILDRTHGLSNSADTYVSRLRNLHPDPVSRR